MLHKIAFILLRAVNDSSSHYLQFDSSNEIVQLNYYL